MKPRLSRQRETAMTLFEVGIIVAVVMILIVLFLPKLARPRYSSKIGCVNNLKQIGLAFRIWEGDNGDIYPMGISITNGGAMEMVQTGNVLQVFMVMSNELSTPKILFCPEDSGKYYATSFDALTSRNVSYFAGVDATNETNPQWLLSGDSHFEIGGKPVRSGLISIWTNDPVDWSSARHSGSGYFGFADGSVITVSPRGVQWYLVQTGLATNRLAIP